MELPHAGFQDRCIQPLCHLSRSSASFFGNARQLCDRRNFCSAAAGCKCKAESRRSLFGATLANYPPPFRSHWFAGVREMDARIDVGIATRPREAWEREKVMAADVKKADAALEAKDAQMLFTEVWNEIEAEFGRENLRFPKEIMEEGVLGLRTNTPFILRERGLTAAPIVMSDLLDTPEMRKLKDEGVYWRPRVHRAASELLKPEYATGVVVDGFPRTSTQVHTVRMLYQNMLDLRKEFFDTPIGLKFRRPIFVSRSCTLTKQPRSNVNWRVVKKSAPK